MQVLTVSNMAGGLYSGHALERAHVQWWGVFFGGRGGQGGSWDRKTHPVTWAWHVCTLILPMHSQVFLGLTVRVWRQHGRWRFLARRNLLHSGACSLVNSTAWQHSNSHACLGDALGRSMEHCCASGCPRLWLLVYSSIVAQSLGK